MRPLLTTLLAFATAFTVRSATVRFDNCELVCGDAEDAPAGELQFFQFPKPSYDAPLVLTERRTVSDLVAK